METFNSILVVSRSTQRCIKVLRTGIALARKFDARLNVLHIIHDPFSLNGWNLPIPSLADEYQSMVAKARTELDRLVKAEKADPLVVDDDHVDDPQHGDPMWSNTNENGSVFAPFDAIQEAVESEKIDLILMLAHREGRLEHFLFGKTNDAVIRRLPATLMLVE